MSLFRTENWELRTENLELGKTALKYSWLSEESQMLESTEQRVSHIKCNCFSCAEFDFSYHSLSRPSEGWVPSNVVFDEWHRVVTKATRGRYQKGGFSRVLSERKWSSQFVSELSSSSWSAVVIPQCPSTWSGGRRKKSLRGDRGKATWWGLLGQGLVLGLQRWWNFKPFICYHTFEKGPLFTWFGQQK